MKTLSTKIGVLGTGNVGFAVATPFIAHQFPLKFGTRKADKLTPELLEKHDKSFYASPREVAQWADVVILAIPSDACISVTNSLREDLKGKVVVDMTNPLKFDDDGVTWDPPKGAASITELLQTSFPELHFVKAYNSFGLENMFEPKKTDLLICGNHQPAKNIIAEISNSVGYQTRDVGPVRYAGQLENLCVLWVQLAMFKKAGLKWTFKISND